MEALASESEKGVFQQLPSYYIAKFSLVQSLVLVVVELNAAEKK